MAKVARYHSERPNRYLNSTHSGTLYRVDNPSVTRTVKLIKVAAGWGTQSKVIYRNQDGLERGKVLTSVWRLDLDSINPLETADET